MSLQCGHYLTALRPISVLLLDQLVVTVLGTAAKIRDAIWSQKVPYTLLDKMSNRRWPRIVVYWPSGHRATTNLFILPCGWWFCLQTQMKSTVKYQLQDVFFFHRRPILWHERVFAQTYLLSGSLSMICKKSVVGAVGYHIASVDQQQF